MSLDIGPEQSFSAKRARELTAQAFELQPWFKELKPEEQTQALDIAVRTITSRFSDAHRRVSYPSWEFIRDFFARKGQDPLKDFQRRYLGTRSVRRGRGNDPWELVYLAMKMGLPDIESARQTIIPHQETKDKTLWKGNSTPGVRSSFRQTKGLN